MKTDGIRCTLYADDLTIWISTPRSKHNKIQEKITSSLNYLQKWCENNGMKINTAKTFYQHYTLAHTNHEFQLQIDEKSISPQENQKA